MPRPIDREQVRALMAKGARVVEVLPAEDYEEAHLPGAVSIPLKQLDARAAARLDRDAPIVTYCHDLQ